MTPGIEKSPKIHERETSGQILEERSIIESIQMEYDKYMCGLIGVQFELPGR